MKDIGDPSSNGLKPYKGPESYQVEDGELFFGREREAGHLTAMILSSRFTLLHAQSGAGKTSLLNARIIPELESRGWIPIRILPQEDPIDSTRTATLQYILPPLEAERHALERIVYLLGKPGEELTLNQMLERYDSLAIKDSKRRLLIAPSEEVPSNAADTVRALERVTPYICRVLRSSIELDTLSEYLAAIGQDSNHNMSGFKRIHGETPLSEIIALLSEPGFVSSYQKLHTQLDIPVPGLLPFFDNIVETYEARLSNLALVLIFDQFEELFTRFIDPGPVSADYLTNLPDWRLRWEFFEEIKSLYQSGFAAEASAGTPLPIRFVISIRSEYIAYLDPLRRFVWDLDHSSYHLELPSKDAAKVAIKEPARLYGYTYSDDCYNAIIDELTKEDRYVEPAHLQIVCEKLWNERGQELTRVSEKHRVTGILPKIELDTFYGLGKTKGILRSFLHDFLELLTEDERLETLEILESLITGSGTRNIIERQRLINTPFRNGTRRTRLLSNLVDHTIVRVERRLGGYFVEITHEVLIGPILEALREKLYSDPEYNRFRMALRVLERYEYIDFRAGPDVLLMKKEFLTLHEYTQQIQWTDWATELMFRSSIVRDTGRDAIATWAERFSRISDIPEVTSLIDKVMEQEERLLTLDELRIVNKQRSALKLSPQEIELLFKSELMKALDKDKDDIDYWTGRLLSET